MEAGQWVEWKMESNRGWGCSWWVPAVVVKVGPRRVTIDAYRFGGPPKRVSVKPEKLRVRSYPFGPELDTPSEDAREDQRQLLGGTFRCRPDCVGRVCRVARLSPRSTG